METIIDEPGLKVAIKEENGMLGINITSDSESKYPIKNWSDETKKYVTLIYLYLAIDLIGKKK